MFPFVSHRSVLYLRICGCWLVPSALKGPELISVCTGLGSACKVLVADAALEKCGCSPRA